METKPLLKLIVKFLGLQLSHVFLRWFMRKKIKGLIIGGVKTMNITQTRLHITNKLQKRHIKKHF